MQRSVHALTYPAFDPKLHSWYGWRATQRELGAQRGAQTLLEPHLRSRAPLLGRLAREALSAKLARSATAQALAGAVLIRKRHCWGGCARAPQREVGAQRGAHASGGSHVLHAGGPEHASIGRNCRRAAGLQVAGQPQIGAAGVALAHHLDGRARQPARTDISSAYPGTEHCRLPVAVPPELLVSAESLIIDEKETHDKAGLGASTDIFPC